ncbi:MAG TPA: hypothetical protein VHA05_03585 [Candidatus Saccharimonadales bacterium]|nr:hypothetical protein [Candidatus Saccharimonadales bacterium]
MQLSPSTSYNESRKYESALRHLFLPSAYTLLGETIVAVIALLIFNFSTLNEQVFSASSGVEVNPISVWGDVIDRWLPGAQSAAIQRILLFALWAAFGALLYILVFRLLQIFVRTHSSIERGEELVRADHTAGAWRYFKSLHDFFLRTIITLVGIAAILTGVILCFGIASQELAIGLADGFPADVAPFIISLVGAILTARIVVVGLSLLSSRFRLWYNA